MSSVVKTKIIEHNDQWHNLVLLVEPSLYLCLLFW